MHEVCSVWEQIYICVSATSPWNWFKQMILSSTQTSPLRFECGPVKDSALWAAKLPLEENSILSHRKQSLIGNICCLMQDTEALEKMSAHY